MLKRVLDITTSLVALIAFTPVFILIAVFIKLETPGPVFFLQTRVGKDGRLFKIIKFRKFPHNCKGGPGITLAQDSRMTKMGKILERLKMDELPQFLNVLFGQMSIVGPRPETPNFVKFFKESDYKVLSVKPGIFGVNQLIYRREADLFSGVTNPEEFYIRDLMPRKLENDIRYIERANVFTDFYILLKCVLVVLIEPIITKWKWHTRKRNQNYSVL